MIQEKSNNQLTNWELVSVNPSNKIWNWKDLFCFWGVNIQSVIGFSLVTSLYIIYDLNNYNYNMYCHIKLGNIQKIISYNNVKNYN